MPFRMGFCCLLEIDHFCGSCRVRIASAQFKAARCSDRLPRSANCDVGQSIGGIDQETSRSEICGPKYIRGFTFAVGHKDQVARSRSHVLSNAGVRNIGSISQRTGLDGAVAILRGLMQKVVIDEWHGNNVWLRLDFAD